MIGRAAGKESVKVFFLWLFIIHQTYNSLEEKLLNKKSAINIVYRAVNVNLLM